jgi:AAA domain
MTNASAMLEPDRDQIEIFVDCIFRRATEGFVSVRGFFEGHKNEVFRISAAKLLVDRKFVLEVAEDDARRAAQNPRPVAFCPPLATFCNKDHAREEDIAEGVTISVECDEHPQRARITLEEILGPATCIVRSGGIWTNGDGEIEDKLHLHWRLAKPASDKPNLDKLKQARKIAAKIVGGDPTCAPINHPLRWPGSWHRKNDPPRSCKIEELNADIELDLDASLEKLIAKAPAEEAKTNSKGGSANNGDGSAWAELLANIANGKDLHDSIARLAMKLLRAGMADGAAVNVLRAAMEASNAARDERWQSRYNDIPRAVKTAREKIGGEEETQEGGEQNSQNSANGNNKFRFNLDGIPLHIDEWLRRDLPRPDKLIGEWMTSTSRAILNADTGLGKTSFGMALAGHGGAGVDFLHWQIPRPIRALYVDGEMSNRLFKLRGQDVVRRLSVHPKGLHLLNRQDAPEMPPLNTEAGAAFIHEVIDRVGGIDLIVPDNVMSLIEGSMKDEEAWQQTLPFVHSLTARNIGQLWIHHTGYDTSHGYGTKTREWQMDTVLIGTAANRADTDVSFTIEFPKARERTPETRRDFDPVTIALVNDEWISSIPKVGAQPPSPTGAKFLAALVDVFAGSDLVPFQGWKAVKIDHWRLECERMGLIEKDRPNVARALFSRYRIELITRNHIACNNDLVWIIR